MRQTVSLSLSKTVPGTLLAVWKWGLREKTECAHRLDVCVCVSIAGSSQVKCACETAPFKEFLKRLKKEWSGRRARGDSAAEVEGQRRRRGGREEREGSQEAGRLNETAARRWSHSTACRKSTLFRLTLGGGAVAANSWVTRNTGLLMCLFIEVVCVFVTIIARVKYMHARLATDPL